MSENELNETERQVIRMLRRSKVEAAQQKDVRVVTILTDGYVERVGFSVAKPQPVAACDLVSIPL